MKWLNPYRASAIALVIVGTAFMMWLGKQHLIILENTPYEADGTAINPFDTVIIKISERDEREIYEDESDYIEVAGPFYTLEIEIPGERGSPGRSFSKKMYMGFIDRMTINIPQLVYEETGKGSD